MAKAKYQIIADELREKIIANEYSVGNVIPTELFLQKQYQVSRYTVRQAISLLVNEGYLRREKGSGTYVNEVQSETNKMNHSSKTIGVITTYLSDYIFPSIIRGVERKLRESGYSLLLASTNNDYRLEKESLDRMISYGVDGLIIEPTKSNQYNPNLALYVGLRENKIPMIMINAAYEELNAPYICMDDVQAGFLVTEYLIKKGHKQLLFITKIDDLQGKYRMKGFIQACEQYDVCFRSEDILTFTTESKDLVGEQVLEYLKNASGITGIVCYNDQIAKRLIRNLRASGYNIPESISIIGTDNSLISRLGEMNLTTLSHPQEKMGEDAANWIIKTIEAGENQPSIKYDTYIVEGDSVKDINK